MKVVKERKGAIVRRVHLLGDNGEPIAAVTRFLDHLAERGAMASSLAIRTRLVRNASHAPREVASN